VIAFFAGFAGAVATLIGMRGVARAFSGGRHVRKNFRGRPVVATAGAVLVVPLVLGCLLAFTQDDVRLALTMTGAGVLMALLGYVDDAYGDRHAGGLFGHARALLKGNVTTGLLKAGGGAIIGLASAWVLDWRGPWGIAAGAVVALSSNLANLFDLRPGRAIKLWLPLAVWMCLVQGTGSGRVVVAALAGGALVFLAFELRETVMLGDTGAGLLGIVLGVAAIGVVGRTGLLVTLGVLLTFTLASEAVSFTRVIEAVPPLRWLDSLGRRGD
jgi:UDP-N-acetylmuramyl pentapeptide phosphotransferase/UDP-N-acetylglucosamine-1-phosphate transferase